MDKKNGVENDELNNFFHAKISVILDRAKSVICFENT